MMADAMAHATNPCALELRDLHKSFGVTPIIRGVTLDVQVEGEGRPVVLLHGFPDTKRLWSKQVPALVDAGFQVIVPDQRGYGASDKPADVEAYSIPFLAIDVTAILDHLGIKRLKSIAGGSLGGMQVLMWCALYPTFADSIITMATGSAVPVTGIAWHLIGRKIIESDLRFNGGDYYDNPEPLRGLQVARMVGHMTYLSPESLQRKFGRRRRGNTRQFEIDSYFEYQGKKFAMSYDANSYIRVQAAMDEMDLEEQYGSLRGAFEKWRGRSLLVSFDTDWLFPPPCVDDVEEAMRSLGITVRHERVSSPNGHDTFLIDYHLITEPVRQFLSG